MRELDGIHRSLRPDNVRDVGNRRSAGGTEVQHLGARLDVNVIETAQDTGRKLASERVPHPVLDFFFLARSRVRGTDRDALFAVDGLAGGNVPRDEQVFLALRKDDQLLFPRRNHKQTNLGDENTRVLVRLKRHSTGTLADTTLSAPRRTPATRRTSSTSTRRSTATPSGTTTAASVAAAESTATASTTAAAEAASATA